jgi:hypothetical protein
MRLLVLIILKGGGREKSWILKNSSGDLFGGKKLIRTFAIQSGFVAQLNRAPDYGSGGFKFES